MAEDKGCHMIVFGASPQTQQQEVGVSSKGKSSARKGNFTPDEDKILIAVWLNTSQDVDAVAGSVAGSDQKSNQFWRRINAAYNEQCNNNYPIRPYRSVQSRWQTISKAVRNFTRFLSEIDAARASSVCSEQDKILEAKLMYQKVEKSNFHFDHCWSMLRDHPKWVSYLATKNKRCYESCSSSENPMNLDDDNTAATPNDDLEGLFLPVRMELKEKQKDDKPKEKDKNNDDARIGLPDKKKAHEDRMKMAAKALKLDQSREEREIRREARENTQEEREKRREERENRKEERENKRFERKVERENRDIMMIDTSRMNGMRRKYFESLQEEIFAKRMNTGSKPITQGEEHYIAH